MALMKMPCAVGTGGGWTPISIEQYRREQHSGGTGTRTFTVTEEHASLYFYAGGTGAEATLNGTQVMGTSMTNPDTPDMKAISGSDGGNAYSIVGTFSNLVKGDVVVVTWYWGECSSSFIQYS